MRKLVFLAAMVAASSYAATLYVDAAGGADTNGGFSREKAKKSIQAAIEASSAGDLILVNDGRYEPITTDNKRIEIRSVNGPEATVIDGSLQWPSGSTNRCATLGEFASDTNSVLSGFRLTNGITDKYGGGSYAGTLTNCVLSGNTVGIYGGGSYGGALYDCVLSGNKAVAGGGSAYGTLYNCVLSDNRADNQGGGSYRATLINCVLSGNTAGYNGGGAHSGTLTNCVLSDNTANSFGGGAHGASLNNCVLSGNTAIVFSGGGANESTLENCIVWGNSAPQHPAANNSNCQYCCLDETVAGAGNIFEDPLFVAPANGDYRLKSGSPCIDAGWIPWREDLGTDLAGNPRWVGAQIDMGAYEYQQNSAPSPEPRPPTTWYVDAGNGSDSQTGISPAKAKKTIQAAVKISRDGDCILVSPGTYGPVETKNLLIRISSLEGAEATVIDGGGVTRCATLGTSTNSVLEGFRLQNGSADYGGGSYWGTLNNCVLSGNTAGKNGGGSYFGTLNNCVLRGNTATEAGGSGGGSYDGTLNNCLLTENTAEYGGGSYGGTLNNCTVGRNRATRAGGGTHTSSLVNTIVWENSAPNAADAHNCTATYCCIPDQAQVQGAGNIRNDPHFADATNGNYRLRFDSPCINAGWTKHAFGDTDLAGNPRIAGGKVDIGAYEGGFNGDYVTLDQQGGSNGTARVFATRGTEMTPITIPTLPGYAFGGYYTATNGGGTLYYTASGASARKWDKTEATTLYAKWTVSPAARLRWKYSAAVGRYFAQIAIPSYPAYVEALDGLAFLFADRTNAVGEVYAQLWDAAARAPWVDVVTYDGVEYRRYMLGTAAFGGVPEGESAIWGVRDASFNEPRNIVPTDERQIGLYVRKRVDPVSGNETVAEVGNFLGYLTWTTDGKRWFLPLVEGGSSSGSPSSSPSSSGSPSGRMLSHSNSNSPLQLSTRTFAPATLNAALALGLGAEAVADNPPKARIAEFGVGADGSVSGRVEAVAGGEASSSFGAAMVRILSAETPAGPWREVRAEVDSATGAFALPAGAVNGHFFRAEIETRTVVE